MCTPSFTRRHHLPLWACCVIAALIVPLVLACGVANSGLQASSAPRWACPSPTPKPFGLAGPVKRIEHYDCVVDPFTGVKTCKEREIYYEEWEQEYGALGGPPFPSPTPFGRVGQSFLLGQRVEIWPVHARVEARAGDPVSLPNVGAGTQQLYFVTIAWENHTQAALPIDYLQQVRLRAVRDRHGAVLTDAAWGVTQQSLTAARQLLPPSTIPPGSSEIELPMIGPPGAPETIELLFQALPGAAARPSAEVGTPVAAVPAPVGSPTPNDDLHSTELVQLAVQWTKGEAVEPCDSPGVLTGWDDGVYGGSQLDVAAPPGASRVVQLALNQIGRPYVFGAKGPNAFDCSGLMQWVYSQIGIRIPGSTLTQWAELRPISRGQVQSGDLALFAGQGRAVGHVGMMIDADGDGQVDDMVHAAAPKLGIRIEQNVLQSAYYGPRLAGFRTVR